MMSLLGFAILTSFLSIANGMQCASFKDQSVIDQFESNCPPPIFNSDLKFCCYNSDFKPYCCDWKEAFLTYIIVAAVVLAVLSVIGCVISCFCCSCCFCYKKRHGIPV